MECNLTGHFLSFVTLKRQRIDTVLNCIIQVDFQNGDEFSNHSDDRYCKKMSVYIMGSSKRVISYFKFLSMRPTLSLSFVPSSTKSCFNSSFTSESESSCGQVL